MEDTLSLGRFIRESRLKRGMSLGQLAETVGRSSSSVRRWERDEVAPALTIMPVLAEALEVDLGSLEAKRPVFAGEDETGSLTATGERSGSTIEQPIVVPVATGVSEPANNGHASELGRNRLGVFGEMWNTVFANKASWIGWVRGGLTAGALIVMVIVLFWALGELLESLREVWDSFGSGGG